MRAEEGRVKLRSESNLPHDADREIFHPEPAEFPSPAPRDLLLLLAEVSQGPGVLRFCQEVFSEVKKAREVTAFIGLAAPRPPRFFF